MEEPVPRSVAMIQSREATPVLRSRATGTPSFRCYQCRVANNEDCHENYLKTCPSDQAYDVCLTMVVKNAQQGFYIEKKCALGPCNLRDEKQSQGLGLDTCDRSKDSYSCFECCKGDGCNTNGGRSLPPLFRATLVAVALLVAGLAGAAPGRLAPRHSSAVPRDCRPRSPATLGGREVPELGGWSRGFAPFPSRTTGVCRRSGPGQVARGCADPRGRAGQLVRRGFLNGTNEARE
ncbi:hypothetical protein HPB47_023189 [Ixodes persulcatus]|uniref:Uncharacterized protein n=1 Tax=Ixodes persulcatus TaxID=34615 RepID=A0AC60Q8Q9_IXOPE|nr:hypothetical protein HPB47_023189 [Ixodes persulcatus]